MLSLILYWILSALILVAIAQLVPGVALNDFMAALIATFMMAVINVSIKPLIGLLTLPLNILTLGLFSLVINAAMFGLAAWLVPGFEVSNFWAALLASILLSLGTMLLSRMELGGAKAI